MLITAVNAAGILIGINNTLTTQAVMIVSPVERPVASAAYGFVRFLGGGLAPFVAGKLVEHFNLHAPFTIAAATVVAAVLVLSTAHRMLAQADAGLDTPTPPTSPARSATKSAKPAAPSTVWECRVSAPRSTTRASAR